MPCHVMPHTNDSSKFILQACKHISAYLNKGISIAEILSLSLDYVARHRYSDIKNRQCRAHTPLPTHETTNAGFRITLPWT